MRLKFMFSLSLIAWLTGCATAVQHVPLPDQNTKIDDASLARFYVIRPTNFGMAVPIKVSDAGRLIGKTGPNSYLSWERPSGEVLITSEAENESNVLINAEPGGVYYIQQHLRFGLIKARNWLEELGADEALKFLNRAHSPKIELKTAEMTVIN